jgi:hypothetical protein
MPFPIRRRRFGFGSLFATWIGVLLATGCGGGHAPAATGPTSSSVVGASGGTVATADGALTVVIPAGALAANVTVTVTPTSSPGAGALGTVYELGPSGTQFSSPVTLSLHYDSANLNGVSEGSLRLATFAAGNWQILAGAAVDTSAKTVTGTTTHLSPYGIVADSSGAICATIGGGSRCSNSSTSGGSSCAPSRCAEATDVCGSYPGATMTSCSDGANGYIATCCFAPGASVCFASGLASSCGGTATGNGAGAAQTTCPDAPSCATATDACTTYPGATLQSCADNANGYTGSCCFAPGTPVCTTIGAARSCGGSTATGNGVGGGTTGGTTCPPPPSCADGDPCANAPGSTMQSCTDSTNGYTATCCFPLGELPPTAGSLTGSGGGVDAGRSGTTTGPPDAGMGGVPPNSDGASPPPPPPPTDGGKTVPPPIPDAGTSPPPQPDAGRPSKPDAGTPPPPPQPDAGRPSKPDAGTPPPPPSDAGASPCQIKAMPASGAGMPCGVTEVCPATGDMYRVQCDGSGAPCQCLLAGVPTSATITASCTAFDPASMLTMCGFPANG